MEGEIWKDIEGYEGLYQVSNMGRVKSLERTQPYNRNKNKYYKKIASKILKQEPRPNGYLKVSLSKDKKQKDVSIHRLVAEMFIPNSENKPTVDHIDTIKTNNRVENLRWATQKEQLNDNKITRVKRLKAQKKATNARKRKVRCITTGEEFECISDAVRKCNVSENCIIRCCKGEQEHTGKRIGKKLAWEYID